MRADQIRPGALVAHTTARIHSGQEGRIDVGYARTPEAFVSLAWGGIALRFRSANAAQGVLEGFAAARAHLMGLDYTAPVPIDPAERDYALAAIQLVWERRTPYAVVKRDAYSQAQRRTLRWVDLHMGPITWQIVDRSGYDSSMALLRDAHRTAVTVCLDGAKHRADPTKDDYLRPDLTPPESKPRRKRARAKTATDSNGARTAALIHTALSPGHHAPSPAPSPQQSMPPAAHAPDTGIELDP